MWVELWFRYGLGNNFSSLKKAFSLLPFYSLWFISSVGTLPGDLGLMYATRSRSVVNRVAPTLMLFDDPGF